MGLYYDVSKSARSNHTWNGQNNTANYVRDLQFRERPFIVI